MRDRTTDAAPKDRTVTEATRAKEADGAPTIFDLQRSAGNAAVVSLLTAEPVQAKLQVGAVNDPAEREADQIADEVLRSLQVRRYMAPDQIRQATEEESAEGEHDESDTDGPAAEQVLEQEGGESETDESDADGGVSVQDSPVADETDAAGESEADEAEHSEGGSDGAAALHDAAGSGGSAESEGAASETDEGGGISRLFRTIRRKADASAAPGHGAEGGAVDTEVADQIESSRGGGRPLDPATRTRMEDGFGADFSGIRMHEGSKAEELNRSLNAKAFTTGSDIFVGRGGMDDRVLAHELAHTVQQGAAVRRFMAVKDFEALTYESWDSTKSTAQKEIIKMLQAYAALGTVQPNKGKKDTSTQVTVPPEKLDTAIQLVTNMKAASRAYIEAKQKDPKKKGKRFAGFISFEIDCALELNKLNIQKASTTVAQEPVVVDDSGLIKLQSHYKGTLSGAMEKAALAVEQLAGSNGDSGEFTMELEIPVSPGVFIGAHFKFEAKRGGEPKSKKPGAVEVGCELGFIVGSDALFAKIQAGIGGYFKAQGKDAQSAMKLVSYGLYRRCRESSGIPSGVGNKLWGGDSGEKGKKKAEEWSLGVEKEEFGDDDSFVETGGYASVKASGDVGIASIEGEIMGKTGKRHDKQSLDNSAKGGAGKDNTMGDNWFAQQTTGRSVSSVELSAKATLAEAFGAELKLGFEWAASGKKGEPSEFKGFELEVKANGSLPAGPFSDKLSSVILSFVQTAKKLQSGQLEKASKLSNVGTGAKLAWGIADTTVTGVEGAPTADILKGLVGMGAKKGAKEGGKSLIESASKVGIGLGYKLKYEDGKTTSTFEILHLSTLDAKIPGLLEAELVRRKRLLLGTNSSGAWAWDIVA